MLIVCIGSPTAVRWFAYSIVRLLFFNCCVNVAISEESSFVEAALQPRSVEKSADGFAAGRLEVSSCKEQTNHVARSAHHSSDWGLYFA